MVVRSADLPLLPFLEQLGQQLLKSDADLARLTSCPGLSQDTIRALVDDVSMAIAKEIDHALDGAYDLGAQTLALLRTLEMACVLDISLTEEARIQAASHLRLGRLVLQRALAGRSFDQPTIVSPTI